MSRNNLFSFKNYLTVLILSVLLPIYVIKPQTYTQSSGTNTVTGQTYATSTEDESAVKVTGGTLNISNCNISSSGNSSSTDNSSFEGLNAVVLASGSNAVIISSGNTITSSGTGANGIYSYGASITTTNDNFIQTGGGGHAIMATNGGTITVINDTAETSGGSSSTIATDRGGGTISIKGGKYVANGGNSAAVYSTGDITCTDASLIANGAEALVIEGSNKITLNNCNVKCTYNKWGSMIYQSMSGDANGVDGYLTMTGGSFTYTGTKGGMFFNTNSTAYITLKNVTISNSCDTLIRCIEGSWGNGNQIGVGGITHFVAQEQTISGLIHVDANSKAYITLEDTSFFTGAINKSNTANIVTLTLDASSSWSLTDNSYLSTISDADGIMGDSVTNITGNGHNVYYNLSLSGNSYLNGKTYSLKNGGYLLPEGTTGVKDKETVPLGFNLKQNYPNPFNPTTIIVYQLPTEEFATLKVYDITGREIVTLVKGVKPAGTYSVSFNGAGLASGVYFYQLKTPSFSSIKKMVLTK